MPMPMLLLVAVACLVFVHGLVRTRDVNAQLRALGKPPMRSVFPVAVFVMSLAFGVILGLVAVDFFVVHRNRKARRLIAAM